MIIHGQRWRYQLANTRILVDNAFSWFGWGQERLMVNGEVVQTAGQWFALRRSFNEPWLTPTGDGQLAIRLRSTMTGVDCEVELEGEALEPDDLFEAAWRGRGSWPGEEDWKRTDQFSVFRVLMPD